MAITRTVVVTGAGGGLGHAVTQTCLRQRNDAVVAVAHTPQEAELIRERHGDSVRCETADLRNPAEVDALFERIPTRHALIHLVGGFDMGPTHTFETQAYDQLVAVNLTTTFYAVRAALARMREAGYGRIVTVSSRNALVPAGQLAVYSAVKAAVLAFTQAVADEARDTNITANAVLPSVIDTPANRTAMGDAQAHTWITPAELAESIAFLASDAAGGLRGTALRAYAGA